MSTSYGSINEPGASRQSFSPQSINEGGAELPEGERPVITALEPNHCAVGDPDFTLDVTGTGFTADSVINFAGHDEPTTFNPPDTLSTGVKPSLWAEPVTVQCLVKNGMVRSEPMDFTFGPLLGKATHMSDPDEMEEEIEEAEDEGEFKPTHRPHKRKR